jgi:hypothetical protein
MSYEENFKGIDWSIPLPDNYRRPERVARGPRSGLAAPMLQRDEMPVLQGQHDGRMYDSKAALRASYKDHESRTGQRLIEIGNEKFTGTAPAKPKITKAEIAKAVDMVRQGYKPSEETASLPTSVDSGWGSPLEAPAAGLAETLAL